MAIRYLSDSSSRSPNMLQKGTTAVATIAVGAVALMFSAVLLAVLATMAVVVGGYLWWRTRAVRKQLRAHMQQMRDFTPDDSTVFRDKAHEGEIIDGEAVRVDEVERTPQR